MTRLICRKALQENPNIRDYIREYVNDTLEEYQVDGILDAAGIDIDTDELCDEILRSASYTITGTQTSYNRCTVSVHTENTDFSTLPETIAGEIENSVSGSSFWGQPAGSLLFYFFRTRTRGRE